ncbi:MAG: TlpA disulfide reductase family protein [Thermodesulfobacteriota bacterium]
MPSEDITAPSEIVSTDIKKLDLKKYKGRVLLLMFFATWCGPCREITPEVRNLYTNYKQKGLNIIAVSVDSVPSGIPAVNSYVQKNSIKYPVFVDDGSLSKQYGIVGIPAFILIGKDGVMKTKRLGAQAVNDIAEDIKALL